MNATRKRSHHRFSRFVVAATFTCSLAMVGCRATMDMSVNNLNEDSRTSVLFEQTPGVESCPVWANEAPRVDIFDGEGCAEVVDTMAEEVYAPGPGAQSFSLDDLSLTEQITQGESFSIDGGIRRAAEQCLPRDEYVSDGGDRGENAIVRDDWRVDGLDLEDTIAHFDTLTGEVKIVASSKACIYSPRFAAARKVVRVQQNRTNLTPSRGLIVDQVAQHEIRQDYGAIKQPMATVRAVGTSMGNTLEEHQLGLTVDDVDMPRQRLVSLLPYEGLEIVSRGIFEVDQQESVIHYANAAHAWSAISFAQVTVLGMVPTESKHIAQAGAAVVYEMPDGKAQLRLVKLASESDAKPGDTVNFTIRFDNIGDQPIGNVTIIDNLTTRLEYVADSEDCTLEADFTADDSTADALALRWEVIEPLDPGNGGVIRFKCKVQ